MRDENLQSTFTGKVSVALADIKNAQTSNVFELEFAPPGGAPPRITGLKRVRRMMPLALRMLIK